MSLWELYPTGGAFADPSQRMGLFLLHTKTPEALVETLIRVLVGLADQSSYYKTS